MSKFEWQSFRGGYDDFAVSKEKYSLAEAIKIFIREFGLKGSDGYIAVGDGYARYRYGRCDNGEPCSGWWLEHSHHSRSCPCYVFHCSTTKAEAYSKEYEYFFIPDIISGKVIL